MTSCICRRTAFVLVLACVLGAGCQDRQRPKPVTGPVVAGGSVTPTAEMLRSDPQKKNRGLTRKS
jgi:hypothetical protein